MPVIDPRSVPIAHHPPRRPISLRPSWPRVEREVWEEQIEAMAQAQALARGERMWRVLVDVARNPSAPLKATGVVARGEPYSETVESEKRTSDEMCESEGRSSGDVMVVVNVPNQYFVLPPISWRRIGITPRYEPITIDWSRNETVESVLLDTAETGGDQT